MSELYIVATPIGNLEDITLRALRVLSEVDVLACEDTRHTARLLNHYKLKKKKFSFHSHNKKQAAAKLIAMLDQGKKVALVTDGGTPGISDPGSYLVSEARKANHLVVPLPGPSALAALLSVAGASIKGVCFDGFLSVKPGKRKKRLQELLENNESFVLFESPHRIIKLLEELQAIAPKCRVLLGREMTKIHEEFIEGIPDALLTELSGRAKIVGEFSCFIRTRV